MMKKNSKTKIIKKKFIFMQRININYKNIFLSSLVVLFLPIILLKEMNIELRKLNDESIIKITLVGTGKQTILSSSFEALLPYKILVNNNEQNVSDKTIECTSDKNEIELYFNTGIDSCESMFSGLENITKIDLSEFSFSEINNMNKMFSGCKNLENIVFGNIDTSKVTSMKNLFEKCEKLISLDLSKFNTRLCNNMLYMFYMCSSLSFLDLSNFDTSSVQNMNSMFFRCSNLTSIVLSSFDTSSVESMYNMFYGCSKLTSLDLSHFVTDKVTSMVGMFRDCSKLENINISKFDTSSVQKMDQMFYSCSSLTSLDLSSFVTSKVDTMENMFRECRNLLSLNLSNFNTYSVKNMGNMFNNCNKLISLDLSNIRTDNVVNMQYMFHNCENLISLDLSTFNTSKCSNMEKMFFNCKKLENLNLSNFATSSVNNMQYMFSNCKNLLSLNVNNFDTKLVTKMNDMFSNCESLISLNLISFSMEKIQNLTNIFYNTPNLLKYCITSNNEQLNYELQSNHISYDCNDPCFQENYNKIVPENKECIDNCTNSDYKYEYNNICYNSCPTCTQTIYNDYLCLKIYGCNIEEEEECPSYKYNTDCFDDILEGYYLKDSINKILDKCHEDCKSCEEKETLDNTNCKTCPTGKYLNFGNCTDSCKNSFYTDSEGNNICKCSLDDKCKNCTKESYDLDLCITCNDGFYPKFDDNINDKGFINCYKNPEGYYLDIEIGKYKSCHPNCKKCIGEGSSTNNNCEECKSNYSFKDDIEDDNNCYEICDYYYYFNESNNYHCTQNEECPTERNKLILEKNKCIDECKNDNIYKYEYENKCYDNCPNGTISNDYICIKTELETQIQTEKEIEIQTDKETYLQAELEKQIQTETNLQTELETQLQTELETQLQTELQTQLQTELQTQLQTELQTHIQVQTDKETEKEKQNESNFNCSAKNLFLTKSCGTEITSTQNKDQLISNIEDDIINRRINVLIDNITKTKQDLLVKENDTIYQITTSDNQKNNEYINISSLNLGDCEDRLKQIYNIDPKLSLIIFKIDYFTEGLLIPIISYEIFHPENKSKLDLNYCKDILIELNIPVSIDEDNLFKYDPNSEYYTDECFPSTSDNGTDIIINDRQNEFVNNNLSLCQNNCSFTGYEQETKKALCDCEVKTKINLISEIIDDNNKLSNSFNSTDSSDTSGTSNVVTMKCVYTLFTKEGLKSNIGSYLFILIIVIFIVSSIFFYKVGYVLLENDIKTIIYEKEKKEDMSKNTNNVNIFKFEQKSQKKKKRKSKRKSQIINLNNPGKKRSSVTIKKKNSLKLNENNSNSKLKIKDMTVLLKFENRKSTILKKSKFKKNLISEEKPSKKQNDLLVKFNDYELYTLTYNEALKYDKRTFSQYYKSLLKAKHPILFSFIPVVDYNSMIIKVCLFFLSFSIYYVINALFINESTIHQIYEDNGEYNFAYSFPQIFYSFVISYIISSFIKYWILSERNIIQIRREPSLESAKNKIEKVKRDLTIKHILFFVISIIFLIFFWYYLSSFGAVYQNTQVYLIKNTIFSFLISFLYPIIVNIIPAIIRIISLSDTNKNRECIYKTSTIIYYI